MYRSRMERVAMILDAANKGRSNQDKNYAQSISKLCD
jgi:hypothetical protein